MDQAQVGRYDQPDSVGFQGWITAPGGAFTIFIRLDGSPVFHVDHEQGVNRG